jgi:hypothetical protein
MTSHATVARLVHGNLGISKASQNDGGQIHQRRSFPDLAFVVNAENQNNTLIDGLRPIAYLSNLSLPRYEIPPLRSGYDLNTGPSIRPARWARYRTA